MMPDIYGRTESIMKKNVIKTIVAGSMLALALTACGGATEETKDYSSAFTDDAGNTGADTATDTDVTAATADETGADASEDQTSADRFAFTYNGTKIELGASYDDVKAAIGDATSEFTQNSCAFDGCLNMYTYGSSFEIDETVLDSGEAPYISAIYLTDDLVSTEEGLSVFMTKDDAVSIYGEPDEEGDSYIKYRSGDSVISIIFDDGSDTIASICISLDEY